MENWSLLSYLQHFSRFLKNAIISPEVNVTLWFNQVWTGNPDPSTRSSQLPGAEHILGANQMGVEEYKDNFEEEM